MLCHCWRRVVWCMDYLRQVWNTSRVKSLHSPTQICSYVILTFRSKLNTATPPGDKFVQMRSIQVWTMYDSSGEYHESRLHPQAHPSHAQLSSYFFNQAEKLHLPDQKLQFSGVMFLFKEESIGTGQDMLSHNCMNIGKCIEHIW